MSKKVAEPRNYPKGLARRARIVGVAFDQFSRAGYWNASMSQIATQCGVTRPGLTHHFPTKESLLVAVLEARDNHDFSIFGDVRINSDTNGRSYLGRLVALMQLNTERPGIVRLFTMMSAEAVDPEHPAHEYFAARYEAARTAIVEALQRVADSGEANSDIDPVRLATEIIALMDGVQNQWLHAPHRIDMAGALRARFDDLLTRRLTDEDCALPATIDTAAVPLRLPS